MAVAPFFGNMDFQFFHPKRATTQSVLSIGVIPIENVVRFSCGPKAHHRNSVRQSVCAAARSSEQRAPFGSALRLGHRNSVRHSVDGLYFQFFWAI